MISFVTRLVDRVKEQDPDFDYHDEYENWFEPEQKALVAEFAVQNLVFAVNDLGLQTESAADIVNLFHDMLFLRASVEEETYKYQDRLALLKQTCNDMFTEKRLTRE